MRKPSSSAFVTLAILCVLACPTLPLFAEGAENAQGPSGALNQDHAETKDWLKSPILVAGLTAPSVSERFSPRSVALGQTDPRHNDNVLSDADLQVFSPIREYRSEEYLAQLSSASLATAAALPSAPPQRSGSSARKIPGWAKAALAIGGTVAGVAIFRAIIGPDQDLAPFPGR